MRGIAYIAEVVAAVAVIVMFGCGTDDSSIDGVRRVTAGDFEQLTLIDLDGNEVNLFSADVSPDTVAWVFYFASVDCPISNRYAPEIRRIANEFENRGVVFRMVYPDPLDTADAIRVHLREYRYPNHGLRDPAHRLVELTGATVTPEVAVFNSDREMIYRGRIDDRFADFGVWRAEPTRRDLVEALDAVTDGRPIRSATTRAVGCYIGDFQ